MGREEGSGFRMGTTCMPVADSFLYMAEPINIVKFKNKIKNNNNNKETPEGKWKLCLLFKTISENQGNKLPQNT